MKCRRLLCLGMVAVLACAGMHGVTAAAGETRAMEDGVEAVGAVEGDFEYEELEDGTLEITGYGGEDTELVIPSGIGGKSVASIGDDAFWGCSSLTSVIIPEGVTSIGNNAFYDCSNLASIKVAEGNVEYASADGVLYNKAKTELIRCPAGKKGSVIIPESVESIYWNAFSGCSGLTGVTIPSSVTRIDVNTFSDCNGLASIKVAEGNVNYALADGVLYNKAKMELICCPKGKKGSVIIPEGVESINNAFSGCSGLTSVTIPKSMTRIGGYAFDGCSSLTGIEILSGVTSIGDYAFRYCSSLTGIEIPNSVTRISEVAFFGCNGLTSIKVAEGNVNYASADGILYNKAKTELIYCPAGKKGSVIIPEGVTSIGNSVFSGCGGLTSIAIPESVTEIGAMAFRDCSSLTGITLPSGIETINRGTFYNCSSLTEIEIPENVTDIYMTGHNGVDYGVFWGCSNLKSITVAEGNVDYASQDGVLYDGDKTEMLCCPEGNDRDIVIPASVTSMYHGYWDWEYPFKSCHSLKSVTVEDGNANFASVDGALYDKDMKLLIHCPGGKEGKLVIPEGVTTIGFMAFCGRSLEEVVIPASMEKIGVYEGDYPQNGVEYFYYDEGLERITVAEGNPVYASADGALYNKDKTELLRCPAGRDGEVVLPKETAEIAGSAFNRCVGLTGIETEEGNAHFASEEGILYDYGKTTLIRYPGNREGSYTLPKTVTEIGDAFYGDRIKDIKIPEGITSISGFSCSGLETLSIPSGVTSIPRLYGLKAIFYAGSEGSISEYDGDAVIHYNSPVSDKLVVGLTSVLPPDEPEKPDIKPGDDSQDSETPKPDTPSAQKKNQTITARNMTKTYGAKPFSLGATALGGATLTYTSSNAKVASVALNGMVTLKGCGVAAITVTAADTKDYKAASVTVTLTVKPKKATLVSVKSKKKKTALAKWKRDKKASGYLIECATDKKFKKNKVKTTVGKNKTTSTTVKKLKGGKKYYVRVCAYAKDGKKKIQGDWSKPKTVKVKK